MVWSAITMQQSYLPTTNTGMAQRKRAGLITPRSPDQNGLPEYGHMSIFACTQVHPKKLRKEFHSLTADQVFACGIRIKRFDGTPSNLLD